MKKLILILLCLPMIGFGEFTFPKSSLSINNNDFQIVWHTQFDFSLESGITLLAGEDIYSGIYYELDYSISEQLSYKISLARLYHSFGSLANSLTDWKTEIGSGVAYEF